MSLSTELLSDRYDRHHRKPSLENLYDTYVGVSKNMKESFVSFEEYQKTIKKILELRKLANIATNEMTDKISRGEFLYGSKSFVKYQETIIKTNKIIFALTNKIKLDGYAYDCWTNPTYNE